MSFWVLASTGAVLSRTTVQRVTNLELQLDENKTKCADYTFAIGDRLGNDNFVPINNEGNPILRDDWDDPQHNNDFVEEYGRTISDSALKEADDEFTPDA